MLEFARSFRLFAQLAKTKPIAAEAFKALCLADARTEAVRKGRQGRVSETIAELHLFTGGKLFVVVKPHQMRPYRLTKI